MFDGDLVPKLHTQNPYPNQGLRRLGLVMKEDHLERIMKAAVIDGDGPLNPILMTQHL